MDTKRLVGSRIKELRTMRNYSQEKLAEVAGINAKYLSSVERGMENPTLNLFISLAAGLRVELHELFEIEQDGTNPKLLRRKLKSFVEEIRDDQLVRILRILTTLSH